MREFSTAIDTVVREDEGTEDGPKPITFDLTKRAPDPDNPGETMVVERVTVSAYQPEDGQLAYFLAKTSGHATTDDQVAGIINFFLSCLDDNSQAYCTSRLLDRRDPFGIEMVSDIMNDLIEEWGGHPTKQPSDFAPSRKNGGRKSTARTPELTS